MGMGTGDRSRDIGISGDYGFCFSSNDEGVETLCHPVRSVLLVEYKVVKGNATIFSLDN